MKKDLKSRSISITAITMACQVIDTSSILVCSLQNMGWLAGSGKRRFESFTRIVLLSELWTGILKFDG